MQNYHKYFTSYNKNLSILHDYNIFQKIFMQKAYNISMAMISWTETNPYVNEEEESSKCGTWFWVT